MERNRQILLLIVIAQFCGTSVWFASNAIMPQLVTTYQLPDGALASLTSSLQLGFIVGTFLFAYFTIADRYSPSKVFFICALLASVLNMLAIFEFNSFYSLLTERALVGFCLAGIYPVGMKIAADHFEKGLGASLGFLVGALVLGTAFPHFLNIYNDIIVWNELLITISCLSLLGGIIIYVGVADGPYRKQAQQLKLGAIQQVFKVKQVRIAAFGYFGHMWELYAFWAFAPILILSFQEKFQAFSIDLSYIYFFVIAIGSSGCILAAYMAQKFGSARVAFSSLSISGICCLLTPLVYYSGNSHLFLIFINIWGISVVADSPLFSTLVAQSASQELKGTALTLVNSIGFAITILSIQLLNSSGLIIETPYLFCLLALGPISGLVYYKRH